MVAIDFKLQSHERNDTRMDQVPATGKCTAGIGLSHVAVIAAIIVLAAAWEWHGGRPPICPCGRIALWADNVHGPENSQMVADWYSLSHVVHGLLFYLVLAFVLPSQAVGTRLVVATGIEAIWELVENSPAIIARYRAVTMAAGYSGDSILNSMGDIGFMTLGFLLAWRLRAPTAVALGIGLELVALAVIRDNLTLNVVMLLHPIDAIRVWQGG